VKKVLVFVATLACALPVMGSTAFADGVEEAPAAPAPSVTSLIEGITADRASVAKLRQEESTAERAKAPLQAERAIYESQLRNRLAPIEVKILADVGKLKADADKHNAGVARSEANCAGALPAPQFARCEGERRHWDASKRALDDRKSALQGRATAFERAVAPYARRISQIDGQLEQNERTAAAARRAIAELEAHIRELQAKLVDACKAPADPESIKHCNDIVWSGADPKLPRLGTPRPPTVIVPNTP
jgi:hypothetical protein